MLSKDDILAALAAVPGPDGKTPLNQSGAIDGVTIRDGKVFVAIRDQSGAARASWRRCAPPPRRGSRRCPASPRRW